MNSGVLFIGEAPGIEDDKTGVAFVGDSGKKLEEAINSTEGLSNLLPRMTHLVKCRPTRISPYGRLVNRPPSGNEVRACQTHIAQEIAMMEPHVIVLLGDLVLKWFVGRFVGPVVEEPKISKYHGKLYPVDTIRVEDERLDSWEHRVQVFCLYHPSVLLYQDGMTEIYKSDILKLAEIVGKSGTW